MSLVVLFPVGKETSADGYCDFCDLNNPDTESTQWYPRDRVDVHGQRVVGYLGPLGFIWNGEPFPEPEGGEEARADGVLSTTVDWPIEE